MYVRKLSLINFKNVRQADVEFSPGVNCFVGCNGAGKTNIIDAVYYLSMCKSSLTMTDGQSIMHGEDFFMLSGDYVADSGSHESVTCSFKRNSGKCLKRNSKEYERLSDHIGLIPAVIVSPGDVFIVNDAADERRRWLNSFVSQTDRGYLNSLIRYNHILSERNKLLKQMNGISGADILEVLDEQMVLHGELIHARRADTVGKLGPIAADYYRVISGDREQVELTYRSELNDMSFMEVLRKARQKDMVNQFSTAGIHRDDMVMKIGGYPLRKYGSQGQQKSFLIALKLAQHTMLAQQSGERPVLLLDDLFDKLDSERLGALINLVNDPEFGQIIISDCNRSRLITVLDDCGVDYSLFEVSDGKVIREK